MDTRDLYKLVRELSEEKDDVINLYDSMDIELNEGFVIETGVVGFTEDGVIVHLDEDAMEFLDINGVLLESEQLKEDVEDYPVYNAVLNRITRQNLDLLSKYGPAAVMAAVEDLAYDVGDDLEEIGSSDVSIWVNQVAKSLEAGHYKDLHEGEYDEVDTFKAKLSKSNDPFEMIYDAISGKYGEKIRHEFQEMYDDVVIDSQGRLHPDDDFEQIISTIVDQYVNDEIYEADHLDELSTIKRLAGHEEVDEAKGDITVTTRTPAEYMKHRADSEKSKVSAPIDPKTGKTLFQKLSGDEQVDEAEYQGRKVQLNKPMQGDVKKSKVYVKKPDGKVVKVNFGDKNMKIKKSNPARRKSFRARHNCDNPGPKWRARYWSCRSW